MKRMMLLFVVVCSFVSTAHAQSYDIPYYFGFVTTSGGTTLNDRIWIVEEKRGTDQDFPWVWDVSPASARMIHNSNGRVLMTSWYYDSGWILDTTEIFEVDATSYTYCGMYNHMGSYSALPQSKIRFERTSTVNELIAFTANYDIEPLGSTATGHKALVLFDDDVTIPAARIPISSDLSGCLALSLIEWQPTETYSNMFYLCPNRPMMLGQHGEHVNPDSGNGLRLFQPDAHTKVLAWGTGGVYYNSFTSDAQIATIEATIDGLTLPTTSTTPSTGSSGGKVVVVPLM